MYYEVKIRLIFNQYAAMVTRYSYVKNEYLVIRICMIEIEIMGSKWMYLHELNRRIISISKN